MLCTYTNPLCRLVPASWQSAIRIDRVGEGMFMSLVFLDLVGQLRPHPTQYWRQLEKEQLHFLSPQFLAGSDVHSGHTRPKFKFLFCLRQFESIDFEPSRESILLTLGWRFVLPVELLTFAWSNKILHKPVRMTLQPKDQSTHLGWGVLPALTVFILHKVEQLQQEDREGYFASNQEMWGSKPLEKRNKGLNLLLLCPLQML